MTLQATHGCLAPNGKIDFVQFKNMKFAYSMKLCHMFPNMEMNIKSLPQGIHYLCVFVRAIGLKKALE